MKTAIYSIREILSTGVYYGRGARYEASTGRILEAGQFKNGILTQPELILNFTEDEEDEEDEGPLTQTEQTEVPGPE